VTYWLPLAAELLTPLPETETDVALLVLQLTVVAPGAVALEGLTEMEPETLAAEETVKVAVCVTGPPGPCAVSVYVYVPTARPLTAWLPLATVLPTPLPDTETDVALLVFQLTVVAPGSVALDGLTEIDPLTLAAGVTVKLADCVKGPPCPWAVSV
jgi:hypothetical protein